MSGVRSILVTGGNSGIGLALCGQLAADHACHVFMGTRSLERGAAGIRSIMDDKGPDVAARVELLNIDVSDDASVSAAAQTLRDKGVTLYALVNNAGVGFNSGPGNVEALLNTNFYGPKRCSEAFLELIDPQVREFLPACSFYFLLIFVYLKFGGILPHKHTLTHANTQTLSHTQTHRLDVLST